MKFNRLTSAIVGATLATSSCVGVEETQRAESIGQASSALSMPSHALVGYWHNFKNNAGCPVRLTSVPSYWDVVIVAFAVTDPNTPGKVVFSPYSATNEGCSPLDVNQFKADITTLKNQGKNVVLSLGGAAGAVSIDNSTQQSTFISSLEGLLSSYKFSGVDVDLENGFTHGSAIQSLLPPALRTIHSWYATAAGLGGDMFLSMAPEHPYVQGAVAAYSGIWGAYLPMIDSCRNELDLLHVQLYNNGSVPTPNVAPYNGQTFAVDSTDNLVASVKMLIEGFQTTGGPFFNGLPASKVAFGVPSGPSSSNPPYISTNTIKNAYSCVTGNTNCGVLHMNSNQSSFRGVMSWSINWDMYDVAHNTAGRVDFASIKSLMGGGGGGGPASGQTYKLVGKSSSKCLDIPGGSTSDGTFLNLWTCNGGTNQSYLLTDTGGGQYTLKNTNSGKCFDIPGSSTTAGEKIEQWTCHGSTNQKFTLGSLGNGYYKIVNVNSGQCVDVAGNSSTNGASIVQWTCSGADNQAFQFQ